MRYSMHLCSVWLGVCVWLSLALHHLEFEDSTATRNLKPKKKVSLLYVVYFDTTHAETVLKQVLHLVDEVVIIDGPRNITIGVLDSVGMLYSEENSPVKAFSDKFFKSYPQLAVNYFYRVWTDQTHQRNFGFSACTHPVVLQLDQDMLFHFSVAAINRFLDDDKYKVAGVSTVTVFKDLNQLLSFTSGPKTKATVVWYPLMGKRHQLTAEQYFAHLWIVGSNHKGMNKKLNYPDPIGLCFHYTLQRTLDGSYLKYAYYLSHYYVNNLPNWRAKINDWIDLNNRVRRAVDVTTAKQVFVRQMMESALCIRPNMSFHVLPVQDPLLLDLSKNWGSCTHSIIDEGPNEGKLTVVHQKDTWFGVSQKLLDRGHLMVAGRGVSSFSVKVVDFFMAPRHNKVYDLGTFKAIRKSSLVHIPLPDYKSGDVVKRVFNMICHLEHPNKAMVGFIKVT